MSIRNAVQQGAFIYVYNQEGAETAAIAVAAGLEDGLKGYTASFVNVRQGAFLYTYDEYGSEISALVVG